MKKSVFKGKSLVFLCCFASLFFAPVVKAAAAVPFNVPEQLLYEVTWAGIRTGEASLEVKRAGASIQLISRARSSKWVSVFHKVDDLVVSTLKEERPKGLYENFVGAPLNYRIRLHEGRHVRDKEVAFDHTAKKATYTNYLNKEKLAFDIKGQVLDPLSSFYFIRTLPLEVGKSVYVDLFDSKKLYKAEVQVLKKEVIETSAGTFHTILIKPIIKSEGIFIRRGEILIWLTDDHKRIPVQLKTKAALGSVKAMLTGGQY
ncbi:MAG TPA: DUF3108 domain-containing protein [Dissulfurispiraceae bacterium]